MAISSKPKSRKVVESDLKENKALDFIKQGGSQAHGDKSLEEPAPTIFNKGRYTTKTNPDDQVSISIKLLVSERNKINELRAKRSLRNKVSLQDWIIEAVNEKIEKDFQAFNQT